MLKNDNNLPLIAIIGGHGFVGSTVVNLLKNKQFQIIVPTKDKFDITNTKSQKNFFVRTKPKFVVNFASITNIEKAERQREDKKASVWKTNVTGVNNLAKVCKELGIFLIHISSDGVFPGTLDFPGPYYEKTIPPNNSKRLSWYGYTKLRGEQAILREMPNSAIIRISYPFGNPESSKDFCVKTEKYIMQRMVLFSDQYLNPTYIPDLCSALAKIIDIKLRGIFHVACTDTTTPYKFAFYISKKINLDNNKIQTGSIENYFTKAKSIKRSKFGGLNSNWTQKKIQIRFHSWKKALDELYD